MYHLRAPTDQVYRDEYHDKYQKIINLLAKEQVIEFQKEFGMSKGRMKLGGMIVQKESRRLKVKVKVKRWKENYLRNLPRAG